MSQDRFIGLLDAGGYAWCSVDGGAWIEARNATFVERFGTTKRFLDLVDAAERDRVNAAIAHSPVGPLPLEFRLANGPTASWTGVRRIDGGIDLVSATGSHAESRIDDLEHKTEQLEDFVYVVTHDLHEPIRMVTSFTELLETDHGDELSEDARDYVRHAADGGRQMLAIVHDLLGFSRVHHRGAPFRMFEMTEALAAAIDDLAPLIEVSQALILDDLLPRVVGDEKQVVVVLKHVLHNALKFRSDASPRIEINASADGKMIRFTVTDNGIGMNEKHLEPVFGIFKQLHPRGTYDGTGIGLPLSRRIVERHGGRMWAEPRSGGARISFTLPSAPS